MPRKPNPSWPRPRRAGPRPRTRLRYSYAGQAPGRGFTLVELMVVMAIISILVSMTVTVIWAARKHFYRTEAKMTLKQMSIGMTNLKQNNDYPPMTPVGIYTSGRTTQSSTDFVDPNRDFADDGVDGGKLYILSGVATGERSISGASGDTLTLGGADFTKAELDLDYFIIKADGTPYPEVDVGRELDPKNEAWAATYTPHLNGRRVLYHPCKPKRIRGGLFRDPWGEPYLYRLEPGTGVIVEKLFSSGPDMTMGTIDDIVEVIIEIPFGG